MIIQDIVDVHDNVGRNVSEVLLFFLFFFLLYIPCKSFLKRTGRNIGPQIPRKIFYFPIYSYQTILSKIRPIHHLLKNPKSLTPLKMNFLGREGYCFLLTGGEMLSPSSLKKKISVLEKNPGHRDFKSQYWKPLESLFNRENVQGASRPSKTLAVLLWYLQN